MKIFPVNESLLPEKNSYILLDTNVLERLRLNEDFQEAFFSSWFKECFFIVDPLVIIEYLKDTVVTADLRKKMDFIKAKPLDILPEHPEIRESLKEKAIEISRILRNNGTKSPPITDLFLMSSLAQYQSKKIYLFTADFEDFSFDIFETKALFSVKFDTSKNTFKDKLIHFQLISINKQVYSREKSKLKKIH